MEDLRHVLHDIAGVKHNQDDVDKQKLLFQIKKRLQWEI